MNEARVVHILANGRFKEATQAKSLDFRKTVTLLVNAGVVAADVALREHNRNDRVTEDESSA